MSTRPILSNLVEARPRYATPPPGGSCIFAQTAVISSTATRDGRRQSRLIRGDANGFEVCTIDHARGGVVRLDASISYTDENHEVGVSAHDAVAPWAATLAKALAIAAAFHVGLGVVSRRLGIS